MKGVLFASDVICLCLLPYFSRTAHRLFSLELIFQKLQILAAPRQWPLGPQLRTILRSPQKDNLFSLLNTSFLFRLFLVPRFPESSATPKRWSLGQLPPPCFFALLHGFVVHVAAAVGDVLRRNQEGFEGRSSVMGGAALGRFRFFISKTGLFFPEFPRLATPQRWSLTVDPWDCRRLRTQVRMMTAVYRSVRPHPFLSLRSVWCFGCLPLL